MLHNQVAMLSGRPAGGKSPSDEGEETSAFSYPDGLD